MQDYINLMLCALCAFFCIPEAYNQQVDPNIPPLGCLIFKGACEDKPNREVINTYLYRTMNGSYNSFYDVNKGKAHTPFIRRYNNAAYDIDGQSMVDRGNPRDISNLVCQQNENIPDPDGLSNMVFTFLQFLDHDITATEEGNDELAPISIPAGDPYFDPFNTGQESLPFTRVAFEEGTGTDQSNPRQQINSITSWIDASMIYGSDLERMQWLRSGVEGKLRKSNSPNGNLLPYNTIDGSYDSEIDPNAPFMQGNMNPDGTYNKIFVSGDVRANEQIGLTAMHTIFMREHNRICDQLVSQGITNDEKNFQYARKIVGGIIQSIVYNELLPALGIYTGNQQYNPYKSPDIFNEFATAAFRLGHTMLSEDILIVSNDCEEESKLLSDAFFRPSFFRENDLANLMRGLASQTQEKVDAKIVDGVRNFLFGPPGAGGLDLASLNIQRGRDHGLPDFNTIRSNFGLSKYSNINQISSDPEVQEALSLAYGDVDNIDAWIGMLCEDNLNGSAVGQTLHKILSLQFINIRQSDRFYYSRDPLLRWSQKNAISNTKLADVINRNTSSDDLSNVFFAKACETTLTYCEAAGESTYYEWIKKIGINNHYHKSGNDQGYGDYTDQVIPLRKNINNSVFLKPGFSNGWYREHWTISIDYNDNGIFEYNEIAFKRNRFGNVYGNLWIPSHIQNGNYRMRITMKYGSYADACTSFDYGEVEDYTVEIKDGWNSRLEASEFKDTEVSVYPNPTVSISNVLIDSPKSQMVNIETYNPLGQLISKFSSELTLGKNQIEMDFSHLSNGNYYIKISSKDGLLSTEKIIINRP